MFRWIAVLAAGLAMTTSIGLAGAGTAWAVSPATRHIGNHTIWTMKPVGGRPCEWDKFNTTKDTFVSTSESGDAGTFSQTNTTIDMTWTAGPKRAGLPGHVEREGLHRRDRRHRRRCTRQTCQWRPAYLPSLGSSETRITQHLWRHWRRRSHGLSRDK